MAKNRKWSVATLSGLGIALAPAIEIARTGDMMNAVGHIARVFTGYDPRTKTWNPANLMEGLFPVLLGGIASKIATKLGINRIFAGLPIKI